MSYRYKTDDELEDFADEVVNRLRDFHITIREAKEVLEKAVFKLDNQFLLDE